MTKRYLKDWAYSKIIDYQLTSKAFGSLACWLGGCFMYFKFMRKNCKKMLTELSDYVNIFLTCDAHVQCASGSVVEHLLAKEGVAGSIPVSRFFNAKKQHPKRVLFFALNEPNPGLEGSKSRLPARSLLLQSRVIHRMTATRLALFIKKNLKGCCFYIKRA